MDTPPLGLPDHRGPQDLLDPLELWSTHTQAMMTTPGIS